MTIILTSACNPTLYSLIKTKKVIDDTKSVQCKANLMQIQNAALVYFSERNEHPKQVSDLEIYLNDKISNRCVIDNGSLILEVEESGLVVKCPHGHVAKS